MDTTPLPTQDYDHSDDDQSLRSSIDDVKHYVVRITPYDKFSTAELIKFIDEEWQIVKYVISKEDLPQVHYHLVLTVDESLDDQFIKDLIKGFIAPLWYEDKGEQRVGLPRGFGNKQYNSQLSTDVDKAISYVLKESTEYYYVGWSKEYIEARKAESFSKKKLVTFKTKFQELKNEFQHSTMDTRTFMIKFCLLKSEYEQMINMAHAYQYSLAVLFRREPLQVDNFVENYLYKL